MIISVHDNLQKPLTFKATRLLVSGDDGTPIVLVVNYGAGHVRCFRVGDKDFNEQLREAGILRTVLVDKFITQKLADGSVKLLKEE